MNNSLYFKAVSFNLIEKINFNNNIFLFYCENKYNNKIENNNFNSIRECLLYKELDIVKTEKIYDTEFLLYHK